MSVLKQTLRYYEQDDVCIIPLIGEFDLSNAGEAEALIVAATEGGNPVIIDFSATGYIDSSILSVLVRQSKRVGDDLRIVVPRATHIRRVFEVTGLLQRFRISDTLADAKSITRP